VSQCVIVGDRCTRLVHAGGLRAYGVDPSFNTYSRLYRPDSFQRIWQFFNSSTNSSELSATGTPFAFFPRPSHGFKDGFPVFFPVQATLPLSLCKISFMHQQMLLQRLCDALRATNATLFLGASVGSSSEEDAAVFERCSIPG
jgi:hypothetical protein